MNGEIGVWQIVLAAVMIFGAGGAWASMHTEVRRLQRDMRKHGDELANVRTKVDGLILVSIDDGRHAAALAGLMSRNSPWTIPDVRKVLEKFGPSPDDLVQAGRAILASGPLPDDDAQMAERVYQHVTPQRLAERALEVGQPMKQYLAIWFDLLRLTKSMPGGYDQLLKEVQPKQ